MCTRDVFSSWRLRRRRYLHGSFHFDTGRGGGNVLFNWKGIVLVVAIDVMEGDVEARARPYGLAWLTGVGDDDKAFTVSLANIKYHSSRVKWTNLE